MFAYLCFSFVSCRRQCTQPVDMQVDVAYACCVNHHAHLFSYYRMHIRYGGYAVTCHTMLSNRSVVTKNEYA